MKWTNIGIVVGLGFCFLAPACKAPAHLSYDYGRAYKAAFPVQADLTRESVMSLQHHLGGIEGVKIRLSVTDKSTKGEDATTTLGSGQ